MSEPIPRFAYMAGPIEDRQQLTDLSDIADAEGVPAVLNGCVQISPNLRNKFKRIRDSFREEHDPKFHGSLDQHILDMDRRQSQDYRLALANHIKQVLNTYEKLDDNLILVPGRFDLSVDEMKKFNEKYDLGLDPELFSDDRFSFTVSDGETVPLPGQDERLLGIGGITGFNKDLPDFIQRADFYLMTQTDWEKASDVVGKETDYLVSAAGISGTYDMSLYDGGSFDVFNKKLTGDKLVLDPCPDRLDLHHLATTTGGRPLLHGKVESFDWTIHVVKDRPDPELKFSVHVHDQATPRLVLGYRAAGWMELEILNEEEEEAASGEDDGQGSSTDDSTGRLEELIESRDPDILVLVNNPDEFVDIIRMRLFDKSDHFHIFDSSEDALDRYEELDPSFVILEDRVEGADEFLEEIKLKPGSRLVSVIKIYDEGRDPDAESVDFKIWEDEFLVEPFEIMQLFAQIETELVRFPEKEESNVHQLRFSFRPGEENTPDALGLGNQLIRALDLDRTDHQGLQSTYEELLSAAVGEVKDGDADDVVNVTFHLSKNHLTLTVEVEDGDYIKSVSEKLGSLPHLTGA